MSKIGLWSLNRIELFFEGTVWSLPCTFLHKPVSFSKEAETEPLACSKLVCSLSMHMVFQYAL